ncbi:hypothetical protein AMS68_001782 [Peltaster fructicola]|uniref:Plasma membrane iron permease n=1 Tax=Peltaster fructicola TaxID=286661 RepID=A0A6H0XNP6_9PEZI|nr:hypothetical protein AMS68_001782 [Peltaster fructicola]
MSDKVFAIPVFFICFRESLETAIIISVLLAFLKQTLGSSADQAVHKKLVKQVWWGVGLGLLICLIIGGAFIGTFYGLGKNHFGVAEDLWEGVFGLIASIIITVMGAALLRVSKLQDKWRAKIALAVEKKDRIAGETRRSAFKRWCERYAMFILPFITVLREGLEAVVFIGGVGLGLPATSFPLAVFCGFLCGILVGWLIYKGGNTARLQVFLIVSTCFLYLVAAGLFSKAVWSFETYQWNKIIAADADDIGSGPGSYDIRKSVWHVNCCNPEDLSNGGGGWGIFNALFGWQNSATYGSVLSYNFYWLAVIIGFVLMRFHEQNGRLPFMKAKQKMAEDASSDGDASSGIEVMGVSKKTGADQPPATSAVREISD